MSTNTDTDTDNTATDICLARSAMLSEIDLALRDFADDLKRLDAWVVSATAGAVLADADHASLMRIRVRYLARRNTVAAHATERIQDVLVSYYQEMAFLRAA